MSYTLQRLFIDVFFKSPFLLASPTTASMAGSLSGAFNGYRAICFPPPGNIRPAEIPERWKEVISSVLSAIHDQPFDSPAQYPIWNVEHLRNLACCMYQVMHMESPVLTMRTIAKNGVSIIGVIGGSSGLCSGIAAKLGMSPEASIVLEESYRLPMPPQDVLSFVTEHGGTFAPSPAYSSGDHLTQFRDAISKIQNIDWSELDGASLRKLIIIQSDSTDSAVAAFIRDLANLVITVTPGAGQENDVEDRPAKRARSDLANVNAASVQQSSPLLLHATVELFQADEGKQSQADEGVLVVHGAHENDFVDAIESAIMSLL
jgi:hypothetical protein